MQHHRDTSKDVGVAACVRFKKHSMAPCITAQHSMAACVTAQHSMAACMTTQHSMAACMTAQHSMAACITTQHSMAGLSAWNAHLELMQSGKKSVTVCLGDRPARVVCLLPPLKGLSSQLTHPGKLVAGGMCSQNKLGPPRTPTGLHQNCKTATTELWAATLYGAYRCNLMHSRARMSLHGKYSCVAFQRA